MTNNKNVSIYARNFRGFREINLNLDDCAFIVGDNSSGKTSILHLVDYITRTDLVDSVSLNEDFYVSRYDFFSPYFNNEDVEIAYKIEKEDSYYIRAITIRRQKNDNEPFVKQFSMFSDDSGLIIKRSGNTTFYKAISGDFRNFRTAVKAYREKKGFRKSKIDHRDPVNHYNVIIKTIISTENPKKYLDFTAGTETPFARHIGPVRHVPSQFYEMHRKYKASGEHFPAMLQDMSELNNPNHISDIDEFGKQSKLFEKLYATQLLKNKSNSPLYVEIEKHGKKFDLTQVGVGISQVAPLLVEIQASTTGLQNIKFFLIQQPELHLHPVAQAAIGEFLFRSTNKGLLFIVETHSNFIIDRFCVCVRESKNQTTHQDKKYSIIFCKNTGDGNTMHKIIIDKNGKLIDRPPEYDEFFVQEFIRVIS